MWIEAEMPNTTEKPQSKGSRKMSVEVKPVMSADRKSGRQTFIRIMDDSAESKKPPSQKLLDWYMHA